MNQFDLVKEKLITQNPHEKEYLQAVDEVLGSLKLVEEKHPEYFKNNLLERIVEPERIIIFRVPWVDDNGNVQVNKGYRVQFNSAIGPYKGGIRFVPSVNLSIIKFLGFEQTFKNALTTLPMGGGKGGSDFNPKGKSDNEVMRFCQSFMAELYRHIGADTDVPAGDRGVGAREVGYMYGYYKKLRNEFTGTYTGKGLTWGGSLARPEATGYGLCYFTDALLRDHNDSFVGKTVIVSGAGNVAIYTVEKATELGAKVVAMSDTLGYLYDENGIDLDLVKQIKLVKRSSLKEYVETHPHAVYGEGNENMWSIKCDIALPCATENELDEAHAKILVENGCKVVCEGANMPCVPGAIQVFQSNGVLYAPGKASNAGGVAVSGLEMTQNSMRYSWTFEEVDAKLKDIMENIYATVSATAKEYGVEDNFVVGANIAGFVKVAKAMQEQGIV